MYLTIVSRQRLGKNITAVTNKIRVPVMIDYFVGFFDVTYVTHSFSVTDVCFAWSSLLYNSFQLIFQ
jgi:hypothetical protein